MTEPNWAALERQHDGRLVELLRDRYEAGTFGTTVEGFASEAADVNIEVGQNAIANLFKDCSDWLSSTSEEVAGDLDPDTGIAETVTVTHYQYDAGIERTIPWTVFVHGMGTKGTWQQHMAFDMATWQGTAPPSYIVKYGTVVVGTFLGFRRRALLDNLSKEIETVAARAVEHQAGCVPDVIAHSLGTWLIGHLLLEQLDRPTDERLRIGRLIVTGSILRPDFPWGRLQEAGVVDDVLNHYGTKDLVVRLAHGTVRDSGPSGRRGFDVEAAAPIDGRRVLNVAAPDHGHSGVLQPDSCAYQRYVEVWEPFLRNPIGRAGRGIKLTDPPKRWKPWIWPFRRGRQAHR